MNQWVSKGDSWKMTDEQHISCAIYSWKMTDEQHICAIFACIIPAHESELTIRTYHPQGEMHIAIRWVDA